MSDQQTFRRAATACVLGLGVQALLAVVVALTGLWADVPALGAATWYFLGGLPVWVILWMIYNQHQNERAAALESEQLAHAPGQGAIFEEQADDLRLAQRRLDHLYRWGLGGVSLLLAAYLITLGLVFFIRAQTLVGTDRFLSDALGRNGDAAPGVILGIMAGVAFVGFIVARYAAGMTVQADWALLRGAAGYLMGNTLAALLILAGAVATLLGNDIVMAWLSLVIPGLMIVVGVEIVLGFILGAYRPRKPGEMPRPAFDSRLLGWLTKPESLAKIINETINYQFGFEISRSWFYQLLSRALTPLIVVGLALLLLVSSLVIVDPQEQVLVMRFGAIDGPPREPGLHFKWPWPIGSVRRFATGRLQELTVGSFTEVKPNTAILWTNEHVQGEEKYIITAPAAEEQKLQGAGSNRGPAASLVAAQVNVLYRITNVLSYAQTAQKPEDLLASLADEAVLGYFATRDIEFLLGPGRAQAGEDLKSAMQKLADGVKLGVRIEYVGLTGVHPPRTEKGEASAEGSVAAAFHERIAAVQKREELLQKAIQERVQILAETVGSEEAAREIIQAIDKLNDLKRQGEAGPAGAEATLRQRIAAQEIEVEKLIAAAPGQAARTLNEARAYRWEKGVGEQAKAGRFAAEFKAAQYAPDYFRARKYLEVLGEGLANPRKYVLTTPVEMPGVYRIDLKDASSALGSFLNPENK